MTYENNNFLVNIEYVLKRILTCSRSKPNGPTRCSATPVLAQRRMMLPVFGGISGSKRMTENTARL